MAKRRGPDNTVRVAVSGLINNVAWANVFWCSLTTSGTPPQADVDTWCAAFGAAYKAQLASVIQSTYSFTSCQCVVFVPGGLVVPSLQALTGAGTGTAVSGDPSSNAVCISWVTGVYWRGGKPRTYLGSPQAADRADHRTLTTTAQTNYTNRALGFRTAINGLTAGAISATQLGFVSFVSGKQDRATPVFYAFTGAKVHPRFGTQRRRLGKWAV